MKGLIIHRQNNCNYFTNLTEIIDVMGDIALEYNWLISNYECNVYPSDQIPFRKQYVWLTGRELLSILEEHEIQFIWGVVTAYSSNIVPNDVLSYPLPFADGNTAFWQPEITMQNPLAEIEIVPWDATLVLIIAKSEEIVDKFANEYVNSDDLETYNRSHTIIKDGIGDD